MAILTDNQIKTFLTATAMYNTGAYEADADIEDSVCGENQISATTEPLENFISTRGIQHETETIGENTLNIWNNIQVRKGKTRGDLFVMEFPGITAAYFGGEI